MKTKYLLPNIFIKVGFLLFLIALVFRYYGDTFGTKSDPNIDAYFSSKGNIYKTYFYKNDPSFRMKLRSVEEFKYWYKLSKRNDIGDRFRRLSILIFYLGAIFIVCSKLKIEDEYIAKIRLESIIWTLFFCGTILLIFRIYYEFNPTMVIRRGMYGENIYIPDMNIEYYVMNFLAVFVLRFNYVIFLRPKLVRIKEGNQDEK